MRDLVLHLLRLVLVLHAKRFVIDFLVMCIGFSLLGWHGSGRGLTACQRLALLGVTLAEHTATQTTLAIRAIPRDAAARGGWL